MARGGWRGGGRPKGSANLPRFSDYVTDEERRKFAEFIMDQYMGDMRLAIFFGQHAFAKPVEHIDHTTLGKELPNPILNGIRSDDSTSQNTEAR
jgi:hypothetical protein